MGIGVLHIKNGKQKLNVKILTESELVGNSDYPPYNLWMIMSMHRKVGLNGSHSYNSS